MPSTETIQSTGLELTDEVKSNIIRLAGYCEKLRYSFRSKAVRENSALLFSALSTEEQQACKQIIVTLLSEIDFTPAFVNSGIPSGSSFPDEMLNLIKNKILPYLNEANDARTIIDEIFNERKDHELLVSIFAKYPDFSAQFSEEEKLHILAAFRTQAINATHIISYRIAALGMDEDIYTRAGKDDALLTPFMEQNREINELQFNIEQGNKEKITEDLAQVRVMLKHCLENIALIDKAAAKNGASLRQTFILRKLQLLVDRLFLLLPLTCNEERTRLAFNNLCLMVQMVVLSETSNEKLWPFISRNMNMIAYRITENKRKTGEHYIATDRAEYFELFLSACGGGFIVSFLVILKLIIHDAHLPLLWESVLYSINYATGFVLIHVCRFTLATKQPAMTAAYIAASLDDIGKDESKYQHLARTIAMLMRSQLVSFAGNLLLVFPLTLLWVFLLSLSAHKSFIGAEDAGALTSSVAPFTSLSFWYAAIAGFWLFMAGIISGFGDNKVMVSKIGARIEAHPFLRKHFSAENRRSIASYMEKNLGPLSGNIALGFLLGMSGFIGKITGLPIDIRHITFAAGNVAMGFYGIDFNITAWLLISCALGIFIIGLMNFAVSFLLALQVAVRSRGIKLRNYPDLLKAVLVYFKKWPGQFFFPTVDARQDEAKVMPTGE